MELLRAKYYDKPDGEDLPAKLVCLNKYALPASMVWATYDVYLHSRSKGVAAVMGRYLTHAGYFTAIATAFATTSYFATKIRGKDDHINYMLGGAAAGAFVGAWTKSAINGWYGALGGLIFCWFRKDSLLNDWVMIPDGDFLLKHRTYGDSITARRDFSIQADDLPKGWTSNPNDL